MRRANNNRRTATNRTQPPPTLATQPPVQQPQPTPVQQPIHLNPYAYLNMAILSDILMERDVDVGMGNFADKITRLYEFDQILPEWKDNILRTPIIDLPTLSNC